jgi:PAS domain S-box-containing protein
MPTTPPVAGVAMGVGEEITEADDALLAILGYAREDLEAGRLNWAEMTPPEFLHLDLAGTRQAAASGGFTVPYQKEFIRKDGRRVPVLMSCAFLPDAPGKWMCYVVDLSPRTVQLALPTGARTTLGSVPTPHDFYARLVHELVRERTRMLAMLGNTDALFWAVDRELRLLGANAAFQASQGQITGHDLAIGESVVAPEFSPEARELWLRAYARAFAGERFVLLTTHDMPDGPRHFEAALTPINDPQEGIVGVSVVAHDVTARRQAEEALRVSEARFRTLAAASPLGVWLSDTRGDFVYANPRTNEIWRLPPGAPFDRGILPIIHPDDLARVVAAWEEAVAAGRALEQEFRLRFPDGAERQIRSRMVPVHDAEGRLTNFVGTFDDETERRALEQRVRQSEKMESLGTLAGGIAHDFNNMLGVVLGHAELALGDASALVADDHPLSESLREIRTASLRARDLVRQILTFSRRSEQQTAPVDLRALTLESLRLMRATMPSTVSLDTRLPDDAVTVLGDASALQQVIVNLCTNAEYAMRANGGGCLTVTLEVERRGRPPAAVLTVRDTGRGIPAHVRERLFEPFFTTKPPGEGTGMGLAVVHGIVTAHGGTITVDDAPGGGAAFRVSLPLAPMPATPEPTPAPEVRGRGRVMLVEDEPALARFATQALTRGGYVVTYCRDGIEALRMLDGPRPVTVDVVVSDVTMPGLTGDKLARELRRLRPELPVILTTGFSHLVPPDAMRTLGVVALLHKPFSAHDLVAAVRDAMERASGLVP